MQSKAWKTTIVTQCLLNMHKYTFRRNSRFGVAASVFVHGSTCITIVISIHIMHIAIFNVGKQKRHFSTSKLTKSLSCNHKHKTHVSTSNVMNSLSYTLQGYCRIVALKVKRMMSRTEYSTQTPKNSTLFSGQYLRNHWTLDIGVLGYIGMFDLRNTLPKLGPFLLGHPVYIYIYIYICTVCTNDGAV